MKEKITLTVSCLHILTRMCRGEKKNATVFALIQNTEL